MPVVQLCMRVYSLVLYVHATSYRVVDSDCGFHHVYLFAIAT